MTNISASTERWFAELPTLTLFNSLAALRENEIFPWFIDY